MDLISSMDQQVCLFLSIWVKYIHIHILQGEIQNIFSNLNITPYFRTEQDSLEIVFDQLKDNRYVFKSIFNSSDI